MLDKSNSIQSPIDIILVELKSVLALSRNVIVDDSAELNKSMNIIDVISVFKRRESRAIKGKTGSIGVLESLANLNLYISVDEPVYCKLIHFDNGYAYLWHSSEQLIVACILIKK